MTNSRLLSRLWKVVAFRLLYRHPSRRAKSLHITFSRSSQDDVHGFLSQRVFDAFVAKRDHVDAFEEPPS